MSQSTSAALPPRKNPTPTKISRQYLTPLETLLQMGVPRTRAEKSLAATGHKGVQIASDWLLAHVNDPTIDKDTPRNYMLYLCPMAGKLQDELKTFWDGTRIQIGRNAVHKSIPHITMTSVFNCKDCDVERLLKTVKVVSKRFAQDFENLSLMTLDKYMSPNFVGLFVGKNEEIVLRSFSQELSREMSKELGVQTDPGSTKGFHLTLAYQFEHQHFPALQDHVNAAIHPSSTCEWELRLYSYDPRVVGNDVYKVLYAHIPREEDELELMIGDFVYVTPEEMTASPDGWVLGTSWLTGCQGYIPKNYIQLTADCNAWTIHFKLPLKSCRDLDVSTDVYSSRLSISSTSLDRLARVGEIGDGEEKEVYAEEQVAVQQPPKEEMTTRCSSRPPVPPRKIFIVRHGERVDFTFGSWIPYCFDSQGCYTRKDLNMPHGVPARERGPDGFVRDTPLTFVGGLQATLVGEAMREAKVTIDYVYCSPSLRCIQTCHNVLKGLGIHQTTKIRIEPGLFEWMAWYHDILPNFMTYDELCAAGFNIATDYKPFIPVDELLSTEKQETCEQFYVRNFFVTQCILQANEESARPNFLFVGHAATLDTCARQLIGGDPRPANEMMNLVRRIPYCSVGLVDEVKDESGKRAWKIAEPPFPPLTHCSNNRFNYKVLLS